MPEPINTRLPLSFFDPRLAYQFMVSINYGVFCFITIGLPFVILKFKKLPAFAWFLFGTGLFSYGLLFEVERGQFNLIAMGFVFLAILLFHKSKRFRWLAYVLFCISIQLKIYPAVFVVFFADDWRDWKKTLPRWVYLGIANIGLLFILGPGIMLHYVEAMTRVVSGIGKTDWPVNHSITGFIMFANYYFNFSDRLYITIDIILTGTVLLLTALCFIKAYNRRNILDPYLLLACTLVALLLPTLSNDYTLAYLIGPTIILFIHLDENFMERRDIGKPSIRLIRIFSGISAFALTSTYFSYFQKPLILQNQFPALFILLICATVLSFEESKNELPE
jgi:hypothetical protein